VAGLHVAMEFQPPSWTQWFLLVTCGKSVLFDSGMRQIGALCYCLAVCLWFYHILVASRCALLVTCRKLVVFVKVTFKMKLNTFSPNHKNRKIKNILFYVQWLYKWHSQNNGRNRRGRDRMVVWITTTYWISTYHH
jgi:hypothetical protein